MIVDRDLSRFKLEFRKNKPFPHIQIKDFLCKEDAVKIAKALKTENFIEKDSDLFHLYQTLDFESINNKELKNFYEFLKSNEFAELMKSITGVKLNAGALDVSGSLYKKTNYLLCHDDRVEDRKIAYIYYLGEDFNKNDGGSLELYDNNKNSPGKLKKKYYPKFNSLMIFEVSNKSWHAVEEVIGNKKRYAIGGWLR